MSRSYPIWNDVEACIYSGSKSFGAKETSSTTVRVGTSKTNSETLAQHVTTCRTDGEYTVFAFGVDLQDGNGLQVLKRKWMHSETREWSDVDPSAPVAHVSADIADAFGLTPSDCVVIE